MDLVLKVIKLKILKFFTIAPISSPPPFFFVKYFVTSLARRMDLVPFNVFNLQMSSLI